MSDKSGQKYTEIITSSPYKIGNHQEGTSKPMGRPRIHLKKREVEYAISMTSSMREASAFSKVSYNTFKKFAKQYECWIPNTRSKHSHNIGKSQRFLHSIFRGELVSDYKETTLLKKAFAENYLEQLCSNCNADFKHFLPPTVPPLVLDFLDGNNKNGKVDNLRVLCLNCVYELRHYKHKSWYRHRDVPIARTIDDELEPQIMVSKENQDISSDTATIEEVEFLPFEEFQKTLEHH
jgi:hypothetical protein